MKLNNLLISSSIILIFGFIFHPLSNVQCCYLSLVFILWISMSHDIVKFCYDFYQMKKNPSCAIFSLNANCFANHIDIYSIYLLVAC